MSRAGWMRPVAMLAAAAAVTLLLALIWERLPARLDPSRVGEAGPVAGAAARAEAEPPCVRELLADWQALSPAQRRSDLQRQRLRDLAARCPVPPRAGSTLVLVDPETGRPDLVLTRPAEADPAREAALHERERHLRLLLSLLALGLVAVVIASLGWLSRVQRADRDALRREVAARREAGRALQEAVAFRDDIAESIDVGLRVVAPDGRLVWLNRAFTETSGWPREPLIDRPAPWPFWPAEDAGRLQELLRLTLAGQAQPGGHRVEFVRPDGRRWIAQVTARALGHGGGWILASTDITGAIEDQRRIESMNEELRRQSSVHLLGERAGELLHKISNHSGACANALAGVARHLQAGRHDQIEEGVRIATRAATQMRDIVERFRPWLRDEASVAPARLREIVADALAQEAGHAASRHVVVHNGVSPGLPALELDRLALCEVLGNLIRNAVWAMEDTPVANRQLAIESWVDEARGQVEIHVRDRGRGVPPELRERIFERGYSTRSGGSGWGLYIGRHWVERLGGTLAVADHPPQGADFIVTLPLRPSPSPSPTPETADDPADPPDGPDARPRDPHRR